MSNQIETEQIAILAKRLEDLLRSFRRVVTGFSAGVDSSVVAVAANRALGKDALAVTAITETITSDDIDLARQIASSHALRHEEIAYDELDIDGYAENNPDRCYRCKGALYAHLQVIAARGKDGVICDGTQADDAGDYRPGRRAAGEQGVRSPLAELGFGKEQIRALADYYQLANVTKPSAPCLSSRVPYGTTITREILDQIGRGESVLRNLGFCELRLRHHGEVARIEVARDEFEKALEMAAMIEQEIRAVGYRYVALDLGGFRSGSLNEGLTTIAIPTVSRTDETS